MPGRQSTGAPSLVKPKAKSRKKSRSLNALAIAEKQVPNKTKLSTNQANDFQGHKTKRQRDSDDREFENEREEWKVKKRRGGHGDQSDDHVERGSDSDGNQWVVGAVDSNEDSEVDSDEAFGESDEEKFEGFMLRGSSTALPRTKSLSKSRSNDLKQHDPEAIDLREDAESIETSEQSDGLGEDAVDLAAMLDHYDKSANEDGEENHKSPERDEGSVFTNSDMEDDQPDPIQLDSLQKLVSQIGSKDDLVLSQHNKNIHAQESTTPSQFGIFSTRKLTVTDLIPSITDSNLKKSLKLLVNNDAKLSKSASGIPKKLDVPLGKRQQDRLNRGAAYEKSKETLNRWIETVKHNRRAEHLAFPLQDPNVIPAPGAQRLLPVIHSQPMTELEAVIQNILQDSGLTPVNQKPPENQEEDLKGLQTNKLSVQEVQARRAELRRAREILFREEIRSRRIKKIKSKSYRRVHRKEREKMAQHEKMALAAAGVDDSQSERDRIDRRRAEERVGARHRESKWAKNVKDSGRAAWDEEARNGVMEAARRRDELTKRVQGRDFRTDESTLSSSESDSDDSFTDNIMDQSQGSRKKFRQLERLDKHNEMLDSSREQLKPGLSSMKFMQKAEAIRKQTNDADLDRLRREAAGQETASEEEAEFGEGRRHFGPKTIQNRSSTSGLEKVRGEFEENNASASGDESRENFQGEDHQINVAALPVAEASNLQTNARIAAKIKVGNNVGNKMEKPPRNKDALSETVENPWLSGVKGSRRDRSHVEHLQADVIISPALTADRLISQVNGRKSQQTLKVTHHAKKPRKSRQNHEGRILAEEFDSEREDEEISNFPILMRDQEHIRKAFAGDKVVADFEQEKKQTTRAEEEQVIDNLLPGWGSWTGVGISKKEQNRHKGKFLDKVDGVQKERRKDAKLDRVIINEKRVLKNVKYLASNLPHPFENRQQYERSLRLPVGPEWTTTESFQSATKPRILMKQGVIAPMRQPLL